MTNSLTPEQIAELRQRTRESARYTLDCAELADLLDAAEENVRLREQVELLKIHGRVGVEALAERDALRAENERLREHTEISTMNAVLYEAERNELRAEVERLTSCLAEIEGGDRSVEGR